MAKTEVRGERIKDATLTDAEIAAANKDGTAGTASMRTLGTGAQQAAPGNKKLDDLAAPDDNTDLNVSTTKHGLVPKAPNDATQYLDGVGAFSVPPRAPPTVHLTSDVTSTSATPANVTGMSFSVTSGKYYRLKALLGLESDSISDVYRIGFTGPTMTVDFGHIAFVDESTGAAAEGNVDHVQMNIGETHTPGAIETADLVYMTYVDLILVPSANGTLQLQLSNEVGGSTVRVKQGSYMSLEEFG